MNILWIPNFNPFPPNNGGKLLTYNRLKYVAKSHNIFLLTTIEGDSNAEITTAMSKELGIHFRQVNTADSSAFSKVMNYLKWSRNVGLYYNQNMIEEINRVIVEQQIDIINIDLPMPAINVIKSNAINKNIPIIINQQNIEFHNVKSKLKTNGVSLALKIYALIESKKLFNWERKLYSSGLVTAQSFVSNEDLDLYRRSFAQNEKQELFCSPIGVDEIENSQHIYSQKNIVFVASFDYSPNIHGAVWFVNNVFPLIKNKVNGAKIYLVGRSPDKQVKELASDDVIVTGTVESVKPYFELADIFIVPIFFGGGVKTKLIEAGIYGKPIISTSAGANGTIYKHNYDILIADTIEDFANYAIDTLKNPNNYRKMCDNLHNDTVSQYLWKNIGARYNDFLERIYIPKRH